MAGRTNRYSTQFLLIFVPKFFCRKIIASRDSFYNWSFNYNYTHLSQICNLQKRTFFVIRLYFRQFNPCCPFFPIVCHAQKGVLGYLPNKCNNFLCSAKSVLIFIIHHPTPRNQAPLPPKASSKPVGVDAHIDPRADVGIRPYNLWSIPFVGATIGRPQKAFPL